MTFPIAAQNGLPEGRIDRFKMGLTGFVSAPYLRRRSTNTLIFMPASHQIMRVPYAEALKVYPLLGGLEWVSTIAQVNDNPPPQKHTVTYAKTLAGAFCLFLEGAIKHTDTIPPDGLGAFKHTYTAAIGGLVSSIFLVGRVTGGVLNFINEDTGFALTETGGAGEVVDRYTVGADGKHVVYESGSQRKSAKLNFDDITQVVKTVIADTTPYGTVVTTESGTGLGGGAPVHPAAGTYVGTVTKGASGLVTFPATRGVKNAEEVATIEVIENYAFSSTGQRTDIYSSFGRKFYYTFFDQYGSPYSLEVGYLGPSGWWISNYVTGPTGDPPQYAEFHAITSRSITYNASGGTTGTLNNGQVSKVFDLSTSSSSCSRNDTVAYEFPAVLLQGGSSYRAANFLQTLIGSDSITRHEGTLNILYSDPTVPVVLYEYVKQTEIVTKSANAAKYSSDRAGAFADGYETGSASKTTTTYTTLEAGILVGGVTRVFYTEVSTPVVVVSDVVATYGEANLYTVKDLNNASVDPNPWASSYANAPGSIVHNANLYAKKLKWAVLDGLIVGALGTRYFIAARKGVDWLVGVTRYSDINGGGVNTFDVYSGVLDEAKLRDRVVAYLAEGLAKPPVSDPTAAEQLAAGDTADYEIRLHVYPEFSFI